MRKRLWFSGAILIVLVVLIGLGLVFYLKFWPGLKPALGPIPKLPRKKPIPGAVNKTNLLLIIPAGFMIETFASDLGPARFMALDPDGVLLVSITQEDRVVALPDENQDGRADKVVTVAEGLNLPHGLAFHKGYLYIAETDKVTRYRYDAMKISSRQVVVPELPHGPGHFTRTIGFGPDGKMYVSIGSSGNILEEEDSRRATILHFNEDGTGERIYARGLRNAVGFVWHPLTRELWATENGRDWLGDDLPPDEINVVKDGGDYGWPYAYGNRITDPEFNNSERAAKTLPPKIAIQAHSAPLGLRFFDANSFGSEYKYDLFVAFHGSWNRSVPTGYKVVRYHLKGKNRDEVAFQQDFITGWLTSQGALGRPVDIIVGADKALYISDDKAGVIYRVSKI